MKTIQLELTIEDTNLVLEALGQMPFARVYALIGRIQERARQQIEQSSEPEIPHIGANGVERERAR
jgi:hypothetical protein